MMHAFSVTKNALFSFSLNFLIAISFIAGVLHDATFHQHTQLQCHDEQKAHIHNEAYGVIECSNCIFTIIGLTVIDSYIYPEIITAFTDLIPQTTHPIFAAHFQYNYDLRGPPAA